MSEQLKVTVEFKGGMELLFNNETRKELILPINKVTQSSEDSSDNQWKISRLIKYLKDNHLKERPELFVEGDSVRPGILVLVNDVDWEILGDKEYKLEDGDNVLFISTLHGG